LASWDFLLGTSKIAPHSFSLLAEREVLLVEFLDGHAYSLAEVDSLSRVGSVNGCAT
jgi:hypothetical protein